MTKKTRWLLRTLTALGLATLTGITVPHRWCARDAGEWFEGDPGRQRSLARGVETWVTSSSQLAEGSFRTQGALFDQEWVFGTYFMAGMGFGQIALEHPEPLTEIRMGSHADRARPAAQSEHPQPLTESQIASQPERARPAASAERARLGVSAERARLAALMDRCITRMLDRDVRAFDTHLWNEDPLVDLEDGRVRHAAYLGYLNLLLTLHRAVDPSSRHIPLNDRLTTALRDSLEASPTALLETYPGQVFPVDNMSIGGSIGLHAMLTRDARESAFVASWTSRIRSRYLDPKTGLMIQSVHPDDGATVDGPRGSGTAFGAYMISFGDPRFADDLGRAVRRELDTSFAGFGGILEYPRGSIGPGDIDSGPVLLGVGVSPTGFSLASARRLGDRDWYTRLYATANLFGAPREVGDSTLHVAGGPLGDAILFAMLTAPRRALIPTNATGEGG